MAPLAFGFLNGALDLTAAVDAIGHPLELLKAQIVGVGLLQISVKKIPELRWLEWISRC